ncbi:hypothetical protein C4J81_19095 (plasmid) [Deltaproteobacteria bacterium Smac51]|nr:hypothetical protein C4J81_19095 [Deltaproteobacteria bacterium Smac51]
MPKAISPKSFKDAKKEVTEIIFDSSAAAPGPPSPAPAKSKGANKDVQIAFYLTREDSAKLNIIHARLQAETGQAISRADRVRNLVLAFIEDHRDML